MTLTKEEAIRRHRMMWEWIANETLRRHECVDKKIAFNHFGWLYNINALCWCCEYCNSYCDKCPIEWPGDLDESRALCILRNTSNEDIDSGLFIRWSNAVYHNDWRTAAYYALYISMLPERKDA